MKQPLAKASENGMLLLQRIHGPIAIDLHHGEITNLNKGSTQDERLRFHWIAGYRFTPMYQPASLPERVLHADQYGVELHEVRSTSGLLKDLMYHQLTRLDPPNADPEILRWGDPPTFVHTTDGRLIVAGSFWGEIERDALSMENPEIRIDWRTAHSAHKVMQKSRAAWSDHFGLVGWNFKDEYKNKIFQVEILDAVP